ncbi:MAG: NADP-dependent phosphogluconate dehydrogenase, partial [bacterium]
KRIGQLSNDEVADVFDNWNQGPLNSFLIEITSKIPRVRDDETNQRLLDVILDAARQKGTGKWTSQDAMELQAPVPTIDVAVSMRDLSAYKTEREEAAAVFPVTAASSSVGRGDLTDRLEDGLRFAMIAAYAQGMSLLRAASRKYEYDLDLAGIARIWRGGCIIRAAVLDDIRGVFEDDPDTANLMTKQPFSGVMKRCRSSLCEILRIAFEAKISAPALASVLGYFDAYRTPRLPSNMIQAQRDFFGSHTYERIDRKGTFHTDWANREEIK